MESNHFWAFFVIALIAGGAITLGVSNATISGHAVQAQPFWTKIFMPEKEKLMSVEIIAPRAEMKEVSGKVLVSAIAESSVELEHGMTLEIITEEKTQVERMEKCGKILPTEMECTYSWDSSFYAGKFVTLKVTAANIQGGKATDVITVYVAEVTADCSNCQITLNILGKCQIIDITGKEDCREECEELGKTCTLAFKQQIYDAGPFETIPVGCDERAMIPEGFDRTGRARFFAESFNENCIQKECLGRDNIRITECLKEEYILKTAFDDTKILSSCVKKACWRTPLEEFEEGKEWWMGFTEINLNCISDLNLRHYCNCCST